ncbi:hypothetical protein BKA69DRAFT_1040962 [Paraphysoderma sedebokerense]|nr:hypothetical protein BKA69DRAFT_1040962 [Paraphysoderma sedebokerense]
MVSGRRLFAGSPVHSERDSSLCSKSNFQRCCPRLKICILILEFDFENRVIFGITTLTIVPLRPQLPEVRLNTRGLDVIRTCVNHENARFELIQHHDPVSNLPAGTTGEEYIRSGGSHGLTKSYQDVVKLLDLDNGELRIFLPTSINIVPGNVSNLKSFDESITTTSESLLQHPPAEMEYVPIEIQVHFEVSNRCLNHCYFGEYSPHNPVLFHGHGLPSPSSYPLSHLPIAGVSRYWFPCIDKLHERCSWELEIVVPNSYPLQSQRSSDEMSLEKISVIATGALVEVTTHPRQPNSKVYHYFVKTHVSAPEISMTVGAFNHYSLPSRILAADDEQVSSDVAISTDDLAISVFTPFRHSLQLDSNPILSIVRSALESYSKQFIDYPYQYEGLKLVLLTELTCNSGILSAAGIVHYCEDVLKSTDKDGKLIIENVYEGRRMLCLGLARAWFGGYVAPKTWSDFWLTLGLSSYMSSQYLLSLHGTNEHTYRLKKDIRRLVQWDVEQPCICCTPCHTPEFLELKSGCVIWMLGKRIGKKGGEGGAGGLLGLVKSCIFPNAGPVLGAQNASNTSTAVHSPSENFVESAVSISSPAPLTQDSEIAATSMCRSSVPTLSTASFLKHLKKLLTPSASLENLKSFADQWIYGRGVPRAIVAWRYNKKRGVIEVDVTQENPSMELQTDSEHAAEGVGNRPAVFTGPLLLEIHEPSVTWPPAPPHKHILNITKSPQHFEIRYSAKYRRTLTIATSKKTKKAAAANAVTVAPALTQTQESTTGPDNSEVEKEIAEGGYPTLSEFWENKPFEELFDSQTSSTPASQQNSAEIDLQKERWFEAHVIDFVVADPMVDWCGDYKVVGYGMQHAGAVAGRVKNVEGVWMWARMLRWENLCGLVGEIEAIRALSHHPSAEVAAYLLRALVDTRLFYRIRMDAALALAKFLLTFFHRKYCYVESNDFVVLPNDFRDLTSYWIKQAVIAAISNVRDENGTTPLIVKQFLVDVFRYNDNRMNEHSDIHYVSNFLNSLSNSFIKQSPAHQLTHDESSTAYSQKIATTSSAIEEEIIAEDILDLSSDDGEDSDIDSQVVTMNRTEFENSTENDLMERVLEELERLVMIQRMETGYGGLMLKSCLVLLTKWMMAGVIKIDFPLLLEFTRTTYPCDIRIQALSSLILLEGMYHSSVLKYILSIIQDDPSIFLRVHLTKNLLNYFKLIGGASRNGKKEERDRQARELVKMARKKRLTEKLKKEVANRPEFLSGIWQIISLPMSDSIIRNSIMEICNFIYDSHEPPRLKIKLADGETTIPKSRNRRTEIRSPLKITLHTRPTYPIYPPPVAVLQPGLQILERIKNHQASAPFMFPVDKSTPLYYDIIKYPMDLSTVEKNLRTGWYHSLDDMYRDIRLIFSNCYTYNQDSSPIFNQAETLEYYFENEILPSITESIFPEPIGNTDSVENMMDVDSTRPVSKLTTEQIKRLKKILRKVASHKSSWPFLNPVTNVPGYYDIIQHPMDLSTIRRKLEEGYYSSPEDFESDVRLMFRNCFTFNRKGELVHNEGKSLEEVFNKEWASCDEGNEKYPEATPMVESALPSIPISITLKKSKQEEVPLPPEPDVVVASRVPTVSPSEDRELSSPPMIDADYKKLSDLHIKLQKHKSAFDFLYPVDPVALGIPHYFDVIKQPIDLSTIGKKIVDRLYLTPSAFRDDIYLMINNALKFNLPDSIVVKEARNLQTYFDKEWRSLYEANDKGKKKEKDKVTETQKHKEEPKVKISLALTKALTKEEKKKLLGILKKLSGRVEAFPFLEPVDPVKLNIPTYFDIIKHPMDLSTIRKKLDNDQYKSVDDFAADLRLMVGNAYKFNPPDHIVYQHAKTMEHAFDGMLSDFKKPSVTKVPAVSTKPFESSKAQKIWQKIHSHPDAWPFHEPVDAVALNIPTYYEIIKCPMDLATIKKKLNSRSYQSNDEFMQDMKQIFTNCYTFNAPGTSVHEMGLKVEKSLEAEAKRLGFLTIKTGSQDSVSSGLKRHREEDEKEKKSKKAKKSGSAAPSVQPSPNPEQPALKIRFKF